MQLYCISENLKRFWNKLCLNLKFSSYLVDCLAEPRVLYREKYEYFGFNFIFIMVNRLYLPKIFYNFYNTDLGNFGPKIKKTQNEI